MEHMTCDINLKSSINPEVLSVIRFVSPLVNVGLIIQIYIRRKVDQRQFQQYFFTFAKELDTDSIVLHCLLEAFSILIPVK